MKNSASNLGILGEIEAVEYLKGRGYSILHKNWRSGKDEIDIIVSDKEYIVFVEVKTRRKTVFGQPWEAVDSRKEAALTRAASEYIEQYGVDCDVRFDIISIVISDENDVWLEHIENAF